MGSFSQVRNIICLSSFFLGVIPCKELLNHPPLVVFTRAAERLPSALAGWPGGCRWACLAAAARSCGKIWCLQTEGKPLKTMRGWLEESDPASLFTQLQTIPNQFTWLWACMILSWCEKRATDKTHGTSRSSTSINVLAAATCNRPLHFNNS